MSAADQPPFAYSLHNVTTSVSDLDASIAWWRRVFGLTLLAKSRFEAIGADVAFLAGPGFRLELLQPADGVRVPELMADPPDHVRAIGNRPLCSVSRTWRA